MVQGPPAFCAGREMLQHPSLSVTARKVLFRKVRDTFSPGEAQPLMFNVTSRCSTMPSLTSLGRVIWAVTVPAVYRSPKQTRRPKTAEGKRIGLIISIKIDS